MPDYCRIWNNQTLANSRDERMDIYPQRLISTGTAVVSHSTEAIKLISYES